MGDFRIVIEATGNHGCRREVKDGSAVAYGCGQMGCIDCEVRRFLKDGRLGSMVKSATLTHWPGQTSEVIDDLLTGERRGSF